MYNISKKSQKYTKHNNNNNIAIKTIVFLKKPEKLNILTTCQRVGNEEARTLSYLTDYTLSD